MEGIEIVDTNADNIHEYGVCGYKNIKRAGYPEKIEWLKDRFSATPCMSGMIKQVLNAIKIVDDVRP